MASGDGAKPIKIEIIGDASSLSEALTKAKGDINDFAGQTGAKVEIPVDADTKPAETTIEQIPSKVNKLEVPVDGDVAPLTKKVGEIPNSTKVLVPVDGDIGPIGKTIGDIPNSTKVLVPADADITMARKTIGDIPKNLPTLKQPVDADTGLAKKTIGDIPNSTKVLVPIDADIAPAKKTLGAPSLLPPLKQPLDIDYSPIDKAPDEIKTRWSTKMSGAFDLIATYAEPAVEIVGMFATAVENIKAAQRARELESLADGIDSVSFATKFSQLDTSWVEKFKDVMAAFETIGNPLLKEKAHDTITTMQTDVANLASQSPEAAGKVQLWLDRMLAIGALDRRGYDLLHETVVRVVTATAAGEGAAEKAKTAYERLRGEAGLSKEPIDRLGSAVEGVNTALTKDKPPLKVEVDPEKKKALDDFVGGINKWVDDKHEATIGAKTGDAKTSVDSLVTSVKNDWDSKTFTGSLAAAGVENAKADIGSVVTKSGEWHGKTFTGSLAAAGVETAKTDIGSVVSATEPWHGKTFTGSLAATGVETAKNDIGSVVTKAGDWHGKTFTGSLHAAGIDGSDGVNAKIDGAITKVGGWAKDWIGNLKAAFDDAQVQGAASSARGSAQSYLDDHPVTVRGTVVIDNQTYGGGQGTAVVSQQSSPSSSSSSSSSSPAVAAAPPPGAIWDPSRGGYILPDGTLWQGGGGTNTTSSSSSSSSGGGGPQSAAAASQQAPVINQEGPPDPYKDPTAFIAFWLVRGKTTAEIAAMVPGWTVAFVEAHRPSNSRITAAEGVYVRARPGGVPITVAEAGQDEIAAPVPMLRQIVREESRGAGPLVVIERVEVNAAAGTDGATLGRQTAQALVRELDPLLQDLWRRNGQVGADGSFTVRR